MRKFIIFFIIAVLVLPLIVSARIGVGVGTGKIKIDEPLKPGNISVLPSITVFNTGDEPADYEVKISYLSSQPQLRPDEEWFSFNPSSFSLEPGQSQSVAIRLTLPVKAKPGDYLAYLEARPVVKPGSGTTLNVAAATKFYFTVVPANIWYAAFYRISYFFGTYAPWSWLILAIIFGAIILVFFRKFFVFQVGVKKP